ncbi:hypothetical protein ACQCVE_00265 [Metabacillus sp. 113a]|uniref:hypothetical protein n=1 Tax=Metabacillus sp. 113a TaxID=3404706 RepID=UPI003CEB3739
MNKEKELEALDEKVNSIVKKIEALHQTMNTGFVEVKESLDRIEKNFDDGNKQLKNGVYLYETGTETTAYPHPPNGGYHCFNVKL